MSKHTHNLIISSPDSISRVIPINESIIDLLTSSIYRVLTENTLQSLYISDFNGDKYYIPSSLLRLSVITIKKVLK